MRNVFEYYGDNDYLEHKDHKYSRREGRPGKWKYWYDTAKDYATGRKSLGFKERKEFKKAAKEYNQQRSDGKLALLAEGKAYYAHKAYSKTPIGKIETRMHLAEERLYRSIGKKMTEINEWLTSSKAARARAKAQRVMEKEHRKYMKEVDKGIAEFYSSIYRFIYGSKNK